MVLYYTSLVRDVTQLYEIVNGLTPSYLNSYISKRTGIHSHNYTRFRENLDVPMFRTATAQCSFHYRSINTWNSLSASTRNSKTLTNFKRCAKLDTENYNPGQKVLGHLPIFTWFCMEFSANLRYTLINTASTRFFPHP